MVFRKENIPWNRGLTKKTDKRIEKLGWNKGLTKETDERVARQSLNLIKSGKSKNNKAFLGRIHSLGTRKRISKRTKEALKNRNQNGSRNPNFGRKHTVGERKKMSRIRKQWYEEYPDLAKKKSEKTGKTLKERGSCEGENNPRWLGGISFEPYGVEFNKKLKEKIRNRDNHICQLCKEPEDGRVLDVHHIDYDKKNNSSENLISLHSCCHMKTNGNREYWTGLLSDLVKSYGQ